MHHSLFLSTVMGMLLGKGDHWVYLILDVHEGEKKRVYFSQESVSPHLNVTFQHPNYWGFF